MSVPQEPIRVAHIMGPVITGGVDTLIMNYYRQVNRSRIQFDFIMDGFEKTPLDDEILALGGRVYKIEPYAKNILKNMLACYKLFKENKYNIVHSHQNALSVFPLGMAWLAGVKIRIAHNHSTAAKGEWKKTIFKYFLRPFSKVFPTHYFACSEHAGRWLFGNKFYDKGNVRLIQNAIDLNRFEHDKKKREEKRLELNLNDEFVIGHIGRFVYQKNHEFLVNIFFEICKKKENVVLLLIGEGDLVEAIKEKVKDLRLNDKVRFLGIRHDIPELMQAIDVFVFPSHYEGFGTVTIEAQASGLKTFVSEAVPQEAQITDSCVALELSMSAKDWANNIIKYANGYERNNKNIDLIKATGFEINSAVQKLERYYCEMLKLR